MLTCHAKVHNTASKLHKDAVPSEMFLKDPNDSKSKVCATCLDCRAYSTKSRVKQKAKLQAKVDAVKEANGEFLMCTATFHSSSSKYPRDKVPKELFRKVPGDPKSPLIKTCRDCAEARAEYKAQDNAKKIEKVKSMPGMFVCSTCHQIRDELERAMSYDGTPSACCDRCQDLKVENRDRIKGELKEVRLEYMKAQSASCYRCRCIYLRNPDGEGLLKLKTFEQDGIRMVSHEEYIAKADDFINGCSELICLDVLEFDHLTEHEQRERGLLSPDEPYMPKVRNVSNMTSKAAMMREAAKCQLLCGFCHIDVTIERELMGPNLEGALGKKRIHVNTIKAAGCVICKYVNPETSRHFHMDHIDPRTKTIDVAVMVVEPRFTFEELQAECEKCRVLCLHCHKLHTIQQRKEGLVVNFLRNSAS